RLLGDPHAAQDVVQETFHQVVRHPGRLLKVESCHNWLLRVARNIGMDHLRRAARQRRHTEALARMNATAEKRLEAEQVAEAETRDERERVRAEIGRLPPRQRELLLLRVQEEKSYREIAEITGLSATNVGFILHHAMKTLSGRLNRRGGRKG
ncbi:MAG: RNA polymerase sigma factor, partial [Planctomycetota bacterium]